ncbi:MAG TPA: class I SAM-dependent methyltransferase [Planctomycetota bacterium]|nr:class I SAM-dependent methyltransferase [Planctomycetota bacterium]
MPESLISNVSDTARWVAVYRALETARSDALFKDPYADRLAGERGRAIAQIAPKQMRNGWPLILRTKLMDDLIEQSIKEGCDLVLNLAAGFDARPYRLSLPASLSWVEADLPPMIEEKEALLAGEKPACRLTRVKVDLADGPARSAFLKSVLGSAQRALVITEGLLGYLDAEVVASLGRDLLSRSEIRWWLLDVASPVILQMVLKGMGAHLANAPFKFAPPNGLAFFEALGWKAQDVRSVFPEAVRARRVPFFLRLFALLPEPDPRNLGKARWSAVVRLERP